MDYTKALRQLEGSWLRIENLEHRPKAPKDPTVRFHDPSCRDFILAFLDSEPDYASDVLHRAEDVSNVALLLEYCLAHEANGNRKYLGLSSWAKEHASTIAREIISRWPPKDIKAIWSRHAKTVSSLQDACEDFDIDIQSWIDERIFELGSGFFEYSFRDTQSLERLMCGLIQRRRVPASESESHSFLNVFDQWARSITEQSEWEDAEAFLGLCDGLPELSSLRESLISLFDNAVHQWAIDEFEVILDNADKLDDAMAWLDDVQSIVRRYLGQDHLRDRFVDEEQRLNEKFSEYEPSPEDLDRLRDASGSIDSETSSRLLAQQPEATWERVSQMFDHLR
ncbi:MAG: hypothetical protein LC808_02610 [Actinobacteria bacterium]|nr:hypothetical protein [Actinomycetota bacterium]